MMKSMAEMQTEYFIACFALTLNHAISRNIIYFKQKNSSGCCCCCLNGKRLRPRIKEHRTSKMGTPKAWSQNRFCLKNGYLEFNLEKCNIDESHSIPVMNVGNLG